jgi:hypothetical protein
MSATKSLEELCNEWKFSFLKKHFQGVILEDVMGWSEEEFLDVCHPHRGAGKKFYSLLLQSPWRPTSPSASVLNLSRCAVSTLFGSIAGKGGRLPTIEVKLETLDDAAAQAATQLDFSCNELFDVDLPIILKFVMKLEQSGNDVQRVVDLSSNRFHGYDESETFFQTLDELLQCKSVQYVVVTRNPCASTDSLPYLKEIHKKDFRLQKLIWIPEMWLCGETWKGMVHEEAVADVKATHERYYRQS